MLSIFILCWRISFPFSACISPRCFCSCLWIFLYDFGSSEHFFSLPLNFCCIFPAMPSCNQEIEEVGPALSVHPSLCSPARPPASHLWVASLCCLVLIFISIHLWHIVMLPFFSVLLLWPVTWIRPSIWRVFLQPSGFEPV